MNNDVAFAQYSYDVKLYRISKKSQLQTAFDLSGGVKTYAYHFEVYNINEPDKVYKYRLPVTKEHINSPIGFSAEVFNLVNFDPTETEEGEKRSVKSRQQILARRYVDNNILLVVQQNKFPAMINLMMVETSSGLRWSYQYEPDSEITSAASFSLLDPITVESFFSSVYDSFMPSNEQAFLEQSSETRMKIDWNAIDDSKPSDIIDPVQLDHKLNMTLVKFKGMMRLQIYDRELKSEIDKSRQLPRVASADVEEYLDLQGAFAGDLDCTQLDSFTKIDIRIKNIFTAHLIARVI